MSGSRIGASVRAARLRRGWAREVLAYHSGVSWSAIAQIETGRRRDVRLSSLAALAEALGVSVDYLVGTSTTLEPRLLEHRALAYGSDDEFVRAAMPFLSEGIAHSHSLLVVTAPRQWGLLSEALGHRSEDVDFVDSADWYDTPSHAFDRYRAFVKEKFEAGAPWIRVVGEPVWTGRSGAEVTAWIRYESMINLAFASAPATIVCPYDLRCLPEAVVAGIGRTHPTVSQGVESTPSATYRAPEDYLLEAGSGALLPAGG